MSVIYKFLFPSKPDSTAMSLLLLALRILFGVLLMSHGVQKWANFDAMSESFPDPLGVGSQNVSHFWPFLANWPVHWLLSSDSFTVLL